MAYKDKNQQRKYQREWIAKRREVWLVENGPCVCGSFDSLEIDHKDRHKKVTHRLWSWTKEKRDVELFKCQVLCAECHQSKTKRDLGYGLVHGTRTGYNEYRCKCTLCREANRKHSAEIRFLKKKATLAQR